MLCGVRVVRSRDCFFTAFRPPRKPARFRLVGALTPPPEGVSADAGLRGIPAPPGSAMKDSRKIRPGSGSGTLAAARLRWGTPRPRSALEFVARVGSNDETNVAYLDPVLEGHESRCTVHSGGCFRFDRKDVRLEFIFTFTVKFQSCEVEKLVPEKLLSSIAPPPDCLHPQIMLPPPPRSLVVASAGDTAARSGRQSPFLPVTHGKLRWPQSKSLPKPLPEQPQQSSSE